jgi:hypothetical protein
MENTYTYRSYTYTVTRRSPPGAAPYYTLESTVPLRPSEREQLEPVTYSDELSARLAAEIRIDFAVDTYLDDWHEQTKG